MAIPYLFTPYPTESYPSRQKRYGRVRWLDQLTESYAAQPKGYESVSCQTEIDHLIELFPSPPDG